MLVLQYTVKVDTRLKEMLEKHHETNFDSLTNFLKIKQKQIFGYTHFNQLVGWSIPSIMAYNGDWNYPWLSLIAYFLFGCVGMAIGLHRYWGHGAFEMPKWKERIMTTFSVFNGYGSIFPGNDT